MDEQLQFPIGKFKWIDEPSSDQINTGMETLANFSQQLKNTLAGSNEEDFIKCYTARSFEFKKNGICRRGF